MGNSAEKTRKDTIPLILTLQILSNVVMLSTLRFHTRK